MRLPGVCMLERYFTLALLATAAAGACGPSPKADDPPAAAHDSIAVVDPERLPSRHPPRRPEIGDDTTIAGARVENGVDRTQALGGALRGSRVGLITNHTGLSKDGRSTIDVIAALPDVELVALFGPEHGIRGAAQAGETVESGRDAATGLPVYSLYDSTRVPTAAELASVDVLVFDIQDIGARYYTYVWNMALAMRSRGRARKPFVVLDRPNPIGGDLVQGGCGPAPIRGLVPGNRCVTA